MKEVNQNFKLRMENGSFILFPTLSQGDKLLEYSPFHPTRKWYVEQVEYEDSEVQAYCLQVRGQWHREWYEASELHHLLSVGKFENPHRGTGIDSSTNSTSHSIGFDPGSGGTAGAAATAQSVTLNVDQQQQIDVKDVSITRTRQR